MAGKKRYSYIKNPYSANGWYCLALCGTAMAVTAAVLLQSVRTDGGVSLLMASLGMCAILLDIAGLIFLTASLGEKNRNRVFAAVGGVTGLAVLVVWMFILK